MVNRQMPLDHVSQHNDVRRIELITPNSRIVVPEKRSDGQKIIQCRSLHCQVGPSPATPCPVAPCRACIARPCLALPSRVPPASPCLALSSHTVAGRVSPCQTSPAVSRLAGSPRAGTCHACVVLPRLSVPCHTSPCLQCQARPRLVRRRRALPGLFRRLQRWKLVRRAASFDSATNGLQFRKRITLVDIPEAR